MKLFKNSYQNVYNLDIRRDDLFKILEKKYPKTNKENLQNFVDKMTVWHTASVDTASNYLYDDQDLLKLAKEEQKMLIDIFNMNNFLRMVKPEVSSDIYDLFTTDDIFRRKLTLATLYNIISEGGANKGAEYGLLFSKIFNFDYSISCRYASYDSDVTNDRLKDFVSTYLELGGNKYVYWLPNYFKDDEKTKYCMEELEYVINSLNIKNIMQKKID